MKKCFAWFAFAAMNLVATAHAVPVLTYEKTVARVNGRVNAKMPPWSHDGGDSSFASSNAHFDLSANLNYMNLGSLRASAKLGTVHWAEIAMRTVDDTDTPMLISTETITHSSEPERMERFFGRLGYQYYASNVFIDEWRVLRTANETLGLAAGNASAIGAPTGVASALTTVTSAPWSRTEVVSREPIDEQVFARWEEVWCEVKVIFVIHRYICGAEPIYETVLRPGRIDLINEITTTTTRTENQTGLLSANLKLNTEQFNMAAPNFMNDGIVNFQALLYGDQKYLDATLNFSLDIEFEIPVWRDVPAVPGGSVPEPGSIALLLFGLAGWAFIRKSTKA